jgi:hypothetical protein
LKNELDGEKLIATRELRTADAPDIDVPVKGAAIIVVKLTPQKSEWRSFEDRGEVDFVLGNARFE